MKDQERAGLDCGKGTGYWSFMTLHMPECVASAGALNGQVNKGGIWMICMDVPLTHWNTVATGVTGHGKTAQFEAWDMLAVESGRNGWPLDDYNRNVPVMQEVRHVLQSS